MRDDERIRWTKALVVVGWMFVLAYLGVVIAQVRRAASTTTGSFEDGLWWQRVEIVSFASVPQNLVVLVPAAAAAVVGAVLARALVHDSVVWIGLLVRIVAGCCYVVIAIAVLGLVGVFFRASDGVGDVSALLGRMGGILMSVGMLRLCFETERAR